MAGKPVLRSFAFTAALLAAFGCADNYTTAPRLKTPVLRRDVGRAGRGPTFFSNAIKYRDKGKKNARAVALGTVLEARALLGMDGRTTLDVSAGPIDAPSATAVLNKVQLKLYAANGALQTTANYNGLTSSQFQTTLVGRTLGSKMQVQANINTGANGSTVASVTETVKLRPDLSVNRINAPATARRSTPITISALVSENNGDVGARADCVLFVEGTEVDRAHGIWVDAGRSVSCMFGHTFSTIGTKQLRVSVVSVVPADWDNANNSAVTTIDIVEPNDFTWQASYQAITNWSGTTFNEGYVTQIALGDRLDFSSFEDIHHSDGYSVFVGGYAPAMSGSLAFSIHDEIDGSVLTDLASDPSTDLTLAQEGFEQDPDFGLVHFQRNCATAVHTDLITIEGQNTSIGSAFITVCTTLRDAAAAPLPARSFTDFNFETSGGDVSFYSEHFAMYDPGPDGDPSLGYVFSFNGETNFSYGTLALGRDYKFIVDITGDGVTRTASGSVHLSDPQLSVLTQPYTCNDTSDGTFFVHICTTNSYTQTVTAGTASGSPN